MLPPTSAKSPNLESYTEQHSICISRDETVSRWLETRTALRMLCEYLLCRTVYCSGNDKKDSLCVFSRGGILFSCAHVCDVCAILLCVLCAVCVCVMYTSVSVHTSKGKYAPWHTCHRTGLGAPLLPCWRQGSLTCGPAADWLLAEELSGVSISASLKEHTQALGT